MRNYYFSAILCAAIALSPSVFGAEKAEKKPVSEAIEDFLAELEPESEWDAWISQFMPAYGNYCGPAHGDAIYEQACLSRLDCICKEHDFGYSLRRYLEADEKFISQALQISIEPIKSRGPDYETFLHAMSVTLFAGKLTSANVVGQAREAYETFKNSPQKAQRTLDEIIDENAVFRKKIEEIRRERERFELIQLQDTPTRSREMSVSWQPFGLFVGVVGLSYEVKAAPILSIRFTGSVLGAGLVTDTYLGYLNRRNFSAALQVGGKLFVTGAAMNSGLYLEPRVAGSYEDILTSGNSSVKALGITPGLLLGFDKVFSLGLQIDLGLGVGFHRAFPLGEVPADLKTMSVVPQIKASIGYAW